MLEKIKEMLKEYIDDNNDEYEEIQELAQQYIGKLSIPLYATTFNLNPTWFMKKPQKEKDMMKGH